MSFRPTPLQALPEAFDSIGAKAQQDIGLLPNSLLTMAKRPEFARRVMDLASYLAGTDCTVDPGLRMMVAYMSSYGAGCTYCQAHTSFVANQNGVIAEKITQLWRFDRSDLFNDRERSALSFAFAAGQVPNAVGESHYDELGKHFSEEEIIDLVAVIAIMGFFNRWNDTMGTKLEETPAEKAKVTLLASGWTVGRHV